MISQVIEAADIDDKTSVDSVKLLKTVRCLESALKSHLLMLEPSILQVQKSTHNSNNGKANHSMDSKQLSAIAAIKPLKNKERVSFIVSDNPAKRFTNIRKSDVVISFNCYYYLYSCALIHKSTTTTYHSDSALTACHLKSPATSGAKTNMWEVRKTTELMFYTRGIFGLSCINYYRLQSKWKFDLGL
jgi:hypothetical protein